MGKDKKTETTQQSQTQRATPTAEERRLNQLGLQQREALAPGETELGLQMQDVLGGILSGGQGLPQAFTNLFTGIGDDLTREMAGEAVQDVLPSFQSAGILDSGTAIQAAARTAGDIRRQVAESNLNRVFNLLNTGLGFGGQQQQLGMAGQQALGGQLAGLRTITGTGSSNTTQTAMNPFLRSFQQGMGTGMANLATGGMAGGAGFLGTPQGSTGYNPGAMNAFTGTVPRSGLGYTPIFF